MGSARRSSPKLENIHVASPLYNQQPSLLHELWNRTTLQWSCSHGNDLSYKHDRGSPRTDWRLNYSVSLHFLNGLCSFLLFSQKQTAGRLSNGSSILSETHREGCKLVLASLDPGHQYFTDRDPFCDQEGLGTSTTII